RRLTEARSQLVHSEKMASVGRMAAGGAHEIGNPIAAILGMEELLLDGDVAKEAQEDFLRRMKKETERIHRVLRDLLDFARPERETVSEGATPSASVRAVLDDVVGLLRPQKEFREVEIAIEVDGDPLVRLAPGRLTQVLLNLALNAGDAMASPTGKAKGGRLVLRASRQDRTVRLEVEDTGAGVPAELRDRIFEPFVTTKEVGEGTGLGLAVCRGIIEGAGGTIALDATFAGGARFVVELPEG
ncbi:MAG TPA: HAMP domain-containing sensor histidine kinase, partial [Polyangiaceae bacterium]